MHRKAYAHLVLFLLAAAALSCTDTREARGFVNVRTLGTSSNQFGEPFGMAVHKGSVYVSDGERGTVSKLLGDGSLEMMASGLDTPSAIAFDNDGHIVVADSGRNAVSKIGADGRVTMIAANETNPSSDFRGPTGIAASEDGIIYVADTYNDRIVAISNHSVSTLAGSTRGFADGFGSSAQFDTPLGLAMWGKRLLVADAGNRRIRVVEPDGRVWTLAGNGGGDLIDGFPLQASFIRPTAITVGPGGAIYIADGNAIRVIGRRSFPFVETISGHRRGFGDGNPLAAQFNRPSGLAFDENGRLLVADSDNGLVRAFEYEVVDAKATSIIPRQFTAEEFRSLQPPRWPFDPPEATRDIAGTLGEIRGEIIDEQSQVWFHNGLDIAGGYGETARFIRDEKVLNPMSTENFGTLRELLRMPTIGYIHIRLGRDQDNKTFGDPRFIFSNDSYGKLNGVRVPRGAKFKAGEPIGTLNAMNHVHMIAGPTGAEMNALAALTLPGVSDSIPPVIENVTLYDEGWNEIETPSGASRIKLSAKTRIVVQASDRMDGNPERRKLGLYRLGYQLLDTDGNPKLDLSQRITFDRNPPSEAVKTVYAKRSKSGYTGETTFNYIVTNWLGKDSFGEGFLDPASFEPGPYTIRVFAGDFFGNRSFQDIQVEVIR